MRDARLDTIRTIAILMVITVHTWSIAKVGAYPVLDGLYHAFEDCGVPLFLMLAGALALGRPIRSNRTFISRRMRRVLLPFLAWSLLVYVLSVVLHKYDDVQTWQDAVVNYIPMLLTNRINYAYWFVPLIAVLFLLTPLLQPALEAVGRTGIRWMLVVWFVLIQLRTLFPDIWLLRYTSSLLLYLGYYIAGYAIYTYHAHPSAKVCAIAGAVFAIGFTGVLLHWPVDTFWGLLERVAIFPLLLAIPFRSSAVMDFCSRGSYDVYLMHFLFIGPLYSALHFSGAEAPLWQCILIPAATTLIVACISYCVYGALCLTRKAMLGLRTLRDGRGKH